MSDGPTVTLLGSDEPLVPWWVRVLPVDQTGKKLTVNTRKMTYWVGVGVVLFAVMQIVLDNGDAQSADKSVISSPDSAVAASSQTIPEATPQDLQSEKKTQRSGGHAIKYSGPEVIARPRNLAAIPPGSMMEAKLVSGASNGLARAQVTKPLTVNGEPLIPEGAYLVGSGSSTEDRLMIRFNQVVFRDGTFGAITAEACDQSDKIVGLKGSKVGNKALNLAGSLGLGFLGGFSTALQDTKGQQGVAIAEPSLKNALLAGTATSALEESRNMMSDLKNRAPIIEVPEGTDICVIASGGGQ